MIDSGDTAWILISTALVLFMTLPGLALFYGGLVQSRNILSVLMHCMGIACLASLLWFVVGYSIAFTEGNPYFGGLSAAFLSGITRESTEGTIPTTVFIMFQMTFAIITPALMVGRLCRTHQIWRRTVDLDIVADFGLRARHPLGVGRWLACRNGGTGLCRRHRCARYSGCIGPSDCVHVGRAAGLSRTY